MESRLSSTIDRTASVAEIVESVPPHARCDTFVGNETYRAAILARLAERGAGIISIAETETAARNAEKAAKAAATETTEKGASETGPSNQVVTLQ